MDFARRRQLLVFDRFLARMSVSFGDAVMLKGGLVLELRLERARTTKDVDLRLAGSSGDILARLQEAGRLDLGDFMTFEVGFVGDGGAKNVGCSPKCAAARELRRYEVRFRRPPRRKRAW